MRARMLPSLRIRKLFLVFLLIAVGWGCSANKTVPEASVVGSGENESTKKINGVELSEGKAGPELLVTGGPELLCSHFKKADPLSISLYFPQTSIEKSELAIDKDHPIISEVRASQLSASGQTAKILIALKKDVEYEVMSESDGLRIHFGAGNHKSTPAGKKTNTIETSNSTGVSTTLTANVATLLESVDARTQKNGTEISVFADGSIKDFTAFTISDPPRIVFDLYQISSPYTGLQKLSVESPQVKNIRHFAYPEKIRFVVDTREEYLTAFTSKPVANGLLISIGSTAPIAEVPEVRKAANKTPVQNQQPIDKKTQTAWLNKIEFSSEDAGKSSVIIGTTSQVRYEMEKIGDRELQLKLYQTRVPQYRKRPLITTRFKSAVDRVTPVQTAKMGDTAIVNFELREAVTFEIDQEDNFIKVKFAASSIPPKPLEQTKLPAWQKVLEGKTEQAETLETVQVTDGEKIAGDMVRRVDPDTGEVYLEKKDTLISDEFDLAQQRRIDPETGAVIPADIYQTRTLKRYTGEKIALNFYETDIKNVFRILGEISQQNFAIDKDVTGQVTLNFEKPVPWDQVLDLVLKMNKLGRIMEGDIIRIATLDTLANEEAERRRKLAEKQAREDQEDLVTIFLRLSYIDAFETARDHLVENPDEPQGKWTSKFNPDRGKVSVDPKQNMIVVTDIPRAVKRAQEIVQKLDKVTPQVLIEARIVETTTNFAREVGFDWGSISIGAFDLGDWGQIDGINLLSDNGLAADTTPTGSIGFGFTKLGGTSFEIVDATLEVFESRGESKTISSPKVLTLDGKQAVISQGTEIPFQERDSSGGASVKFKEALLQLTVTPQVTPDDRIALNITVTRDEPLETTVNDEPPLSTNEVTTELLVEDGETIVIGGIITADIDEAKRGIPGLHNIPVLGYLFGTQTTSNRQTELLIFLTPKVIKLDQKEIAG